VVEDLKDVRIVHFGEVLHFLTIVVLGLRGEEFDDEGELSLLETIDAA
jgi:hypothetical protein